MVHFYTWDSCVLQSAPRSNTWNSLMHFWVHGLQSVMIGRCISNTTKIHMWQFAHVSVITFLSLLEVHKQWFLELGMIMISSSSSFSSDCDCPMRIMMIKVFCSDISCERCVAGALFSRLISESWIATINVGTKKQQQMIFICSWEKSLGSPLWLPHFSFLLMMIALLLRSSCPQATFHNNRLHSAMYHLDIIWLKCMKIVNHGKIVKHQKKSQ